MYHKGVNYFDLNYDKGWSWYQGHFPVRAFAAVRTRHNGDVPVTFEASGYYMYHPHAAARLAHDLPQVKVLVMLRDPIERAYSAYRHEFARGFETESFERALELEDARVEPELERMLADPGYHSFSHRHHSYRRRGQYAEQLHRLIDGVGRERILVVESDDFFGRPLHEYQRITDFLGLPRHEPSRFDRWNARPGSPISSAAAQFLDTALRPHDEALTQIIGQPPSWRLRRHHE